MYLLYNIVYEIPSSILNKLSNNYLQCRINIIITIIFYYFQK